MFRQSPLLDKRTAEEIRQDLDKQRHWAQEQMDKSRRIHTATTDSGFWKQERKAKIDAILAAAKAAKDKGN